ncbi:carboxypeptidase-like regulatory domain-containing protein [Chitinophaga barathri]|uniref:Carboxypeptidase-like regulatory domain-containing protein n=1 Tax=Chitinophaga barathri TaxID=1647451 RepID=A0A3N4MBQ3_9BACT|nr:carboxypeptidase-like regulatory domain-containing protein [Chitinophaga barathri]RPD40918.1 carboxypeptidase-like regulatory domain-containing protein [Chitinophaga barathri]
MKVVLLGIIIWLAIGITPAVAQTVFRVSGKVQDERGKPLPFASAFLNQTTLGDRTTEAGMFTIQNIPPGKYELIVSYLGYEPVILPVEVQADVSGVTVVLKPKAGVLKEYVVRRDPDREKWMKVFLNTFVGQSSFAQQCKLMNGEIVDLKYDRAANTLTAGADDFLVIENAALGYRIKFLLMHFTYDMRVGYSMYYGNPMFEPMKPRNKRQLQTWTDNRKAAYLGSTTQFYKSLVNKTLEEDGFMVQKLVRKERKRDFVEPVADLESGQAKMQKPAMFSKYVNYLYTAKLPYDSILYRSGNSYVMNFNDLLYVTYKKEKEDKRYVSMMLPPNAKRGWQTSVLQLLAPEVKMDQNGNLEKPMDVICEQYWGWEKMAEMLPLDYKL